MGSCPTRGAACDAWSSASCPCSSLQAGYTSHLGVRLAAMAARALTKHAATAAHALVHEGTHAREQQCRRRGSQVPGQNYMQSQPTAVRQDTRCDIGAGNNLMLSCVEPACSGRLILMGDPGPLELFFGIVLKAQGAFPKCRGQTSCYPGSTCEAGNVPGKAASEHHPQGRLPAPRESGACPHCPTAA